MHPEFETIWKELSRMGFFITLQTNASMIQGRVANLLEQYPPGSVKITLYGTDDDIYKKVCRVEKGFTRTDAGIRTLKELKIPIKLVSTVIQQNQDDAMKMAFYAYMHGFPWAGTGSIRKSVRGVDYDVQDLLIKESSKESGGTMIQSDSAKKKVVDMSRKPCTYCRDYRVGYWILWDGTMSFCSFINETGLSVRELSFLQTWKQLVELEDTLEWPEECHICSVKDECDKCAATLVTECGSLYKVKKGFCCDKVKKVKREELL